jgi:adenine specific DNA methylase Mod
MNKLLLGDNLQILKNLESESVDLIYLDPPFFSNRNYEVIWGDKGEIRSFEDRWSGGIEHYIAWLKERVEEMHRILKSTGSIFLHCDWHANAYIRVLILDKVFGEIILEMKLFGKEPPPIMMQNKAQSNLGEYVIRFSFIVKKQKLPNSTRFMKIILLLI